MKDGTVRKADLIVLATGYEGQKEAVRPLLGDAVILAPEAAQLLRLYTTWPDRDLVPDLFFGEVGNIMWKAERQGRCLPELGDGVVLSVIQAGFRSNGSARCEAGVHSWGPTFTVPTI